MAMNTGETQALNTLMRWVLGIPRNGGPVPSDDACREAMWLMDRASKALGAGLTAADVAEHWPGGQPRNDAAFVAEAVGAWDGTDSHARDVLIAIRDQLAGRTP